MKCVWSRRTLPCQGALNIYIIALLTFTLNNNNNVLFISCLSPTQGHYRALPKDKTERQTNQAKKEITDKWHWKGKQRLVTVVWSRKSAQGSMLARWIYNASWNSFDPSTQCWVVMLAYCILFTGQPSHSPCQHWANNLITRPADFQQNSLSQRWANISQKQSR